MKKWFLLLAAALLLNTMQAHAQALFYTNKVDRYYHADVDCDRPDADAALASGATEIFERKAYQKYEISADAAAEFQKLPCPLCVKKIAPVYLGSAMTEWRSATTLPWAMTDGKKEKITDATFRKEVADTHAAFSAYYEEYAELGSGEVKRRHEYPDCFAGLYKNAQGGCSYMLVDPNDEMRDAFRNRFGGGAWIVPAKYGENEVYENRERLFAALMEWCAQNPSIDASPVYAVSDPANNCAYIAVYGEDWRCAVEAVEADAPIYLHFLKADGLIESASAP